MQNRMGLHRPHIMSYRPAFPWWGFPLAFLAICICVAAGIASVAGLSLL